MSQHQATDAAADGSLPPSGEQERMFGAVINHFTTGDHIHLSASTLFSAALYARDPRVAEVVVVDGSPSPDRWLEARLAEAGVAYHHEGRRLGFAEGYNIGARLTRSPWIVLSASDIYPSLDLFSCAAGIIARGAERIGCLIPRLTMSDLPVQESGAAWNRTCLVPLMTLNLNIFERELFFRIGGVPEAYSGAFNDVEMSIVLKRLGLDIVMMPVRCCHFGSLTLATGTSNYRYIGDRDVFAARNPDYYQPGNFWDLRLDRFFTGWPGLVLGIMFHLLPGERKRTGAKWLLKRLPRVLAV